MAATDPIERPGSHARTQSLLHGPIVSTLFHLSWPNILVMLAQAGTGLVETWWISRFGTDALAGMAVVFPTVMLMQMMSQGAMGGGIFVGHRSRTRCRPARRGPRPAGCYGPCWPACSGC